MHKFFLTDILGWFQTPAGMAVVSMWEDGGLTPLGFLLCDIWQIPLFKKKLKKHIMSWAFPSVGRWLLYGRDDL